MVVGGNESLVFGFEKEGGSGRVMTTRLGNDGRNLPKLDYKFTSTVVINLVIFL